MTDDLSLPGAETAFQPQPRTSTLVQRVSLAPYNSNLLRKLPHALLPLALGAGMHAGVAQAQSGVAERGGGALELPAVSVTAKGYAASDVETPVASAVLATEDLARKQAHNLGEALRGEPGISVSLDGA